MSDQQYLRACGELIEKTADILRQIAEDQDSSATLRHAAIAASDVLAALGFAYMDCADEGHPGPLESLADATDNWLNENVAFDLAGRTDGPVMLDPRAIANLADDGPFLLDPRAIANLADDGCPHPDGPAHPVEE